MTLYDLTSDYMELQEMLTDPDVDPEVLADTIEGIEGMLEDKAENYAFIIRNLEAEAEAFKNEAARMTAKAKTRENSVKYLKEKLYQTMVITDKRKFKTSHFSFGIQKNPVSVKIDQEGQVPEEFLIAQPPKIDKNSIKEILKGGDEDAKKALDGIAHLEQGEGLRIR